MSLSCDACQADPELKAALGCDEPAQAAAWVDELTEEEYLTCPKKFIPDVMWQWSQVRAYRQLTSTGIPYERVSGREFEATVFLSSEENKWNNHRMEQMRKQSKRGNDDPELERLVREGVRRRNEEHHE